MKYIVTLELKLVAVREFAVEAATENEASLTACRMAASERPDHIDIISVKEVPATDVLNRPLKQGYLRGII